MRARGASFFAALVLAAATSVGSDARSDLWPQRTNTTSELDVSDPARRRAAVLRLARKSPGVAKPHILKALTDENAEVRLAAAALLRDMPLSEAGAIMSAWLSDPDPRFRAAACEALASIDTPNRQAGLARALGDSRAEVRLAAAKALGSGSADGVLPLLGHLDDASPEVRRQVTQSLGELGDLRAVVPMLGRVQDAEANVRGAAVRVLGTFGDRRAVPALVLALEDPSSTVRIDAIDALGAMRAPDVERALLDAARKARASQRARVRSHAYAALARIGSPAAVRGLLQILAQSPNTSIIDAIQTLPSDAVVPSLVALLKGTDPDAAHAAAQALANRKDSEAWSAISGAASSGHLPLPYALSVLGELDDKRALAFVLQYLDRPEGEVRRIAIETATRLLKPRAQDGRAVDLVVPRLDDPATPPQERGALIRLLGATGSPRAADSLLKILKSKAPGERRLALAALKHIRGLDAAGSQQLMSHLDASEPSVRAEAAQALARVGAGSVAQLLLKKLTDEAGVDQDAVVLALSGVLSRSDDASLVPLAIERLEHLSGPVADALIEGLGRMNTSDAQAALVSAIKEPRTPDFRRKVAEALEREAALHEQALLQLLSDRDSSVRANAAWSLRRATPKVIPSLVARASSDPDPAVAANAVHAWARLSQKAGQREDFAVKACALIEKGSKTKNPYIIESLIVALRRAAVRCAGGTVARMALASGRHHRIRVAAAKWIRGVPSKSQQDRSRDQRAVRQCVLYSRDSSVAEACEAGVVSKHKWQGHAFTLWVAPAGSTSPKPRAPFAVVFADGTMRFGLADRRGVAFFFDVPEGEMRLAVPAPLLR